MELPPEEFWAELLSRNAEQIVRVWETLTSEEKRTVRLHLQKMISEDGWTQPQRGSAQAAVAVLQADDL